MLEAGIVSFITLFTDFFVLTFHHHHRSLEVEN
jgi:hypothetical protein